MNKIKEEIKKYMMIFIDGYTVYKAINPEIFETIKKEESVYCENGHAIKIKTDDDKTIIESDGLYEKAICQECLKKINEKINNKNS